MNNKQLIYVTLDLRRALRVPETTGAKILCAYSSDLLSSMREKGADIWCFEEEHPDADIPQSTFSLLSSALTLNMLRSLQADLRFVVFKPSNKLKTWAEKEAWSVISADVQTCRNLEDKIEFAALAERYHLSIPRNQVVLWNPDHRDQYHSQFGSPLVVQGRMGHAGSNTSVFRENDEISSSGITFGARVKISEYKEGNTFTLNGYVGTNGKLAIGPLFQQMMHVPEWNGFVMGTVGVSPVRDLPKDSYEKLAEEIMKLSPLFQDVSFSGFFGLDFIWNGRQWFLIECNPRLTASVSLQCLIDELHDRVSLLKLHADRAELDDHRFDFQEKQDIHLGQIILRNSRKRVWKTPISLKSGVYRQVNTSWKHVSRDTDARKLREGDILLLMSRNSSDPIDPCSDFASLQFLNEAYDSGGNISDHFFSFYERVVLERTIRESEIWTNRFARVLSSPYVPLFLLRKPVDDPRSRGQKIPSRLIQSEVSDSEVLKLLGQSNGQFLAEKVDGTRGWLPLKVELDETVEFEDWSLPNKAAMSSRDFFDHWKGSPYQLGGNSEKGIDCSAFVQRYFWEVKGILLPKYSQDQKASCATELSELSLEDDDLVFMHSKIKPIAHVAVYFQKKIWHSSLETGVIAQTLEQVRDKYVIEDFRRF